MNKKYTSAPLPFQGQKRKFNKEFRKVLQQCPDDAIYVDLFGGSGFLSHIIKTEKPNAKVIYNDFDNYRDRLVAIPKTNQILEELRNVLFNCERKKRLNESEKLKVLKILQKWNNKEIFIDWITISSSLMFSSSYGTCYNDFVKVPLWNKVRVNNYELANNYLSGICVVNFDYKKLLSKYKGDNVIYVVDPPYLATDTTTYNSHKYWKLTDYLNVLNAVNKTNYIYFTSDKSNIVELCEWLGTTNIKSNPFENAQRFDLTAPVNNKSTYTDTMLFKWNTTTTNDV